MEAIFKRRSVRKYLDKDIPEEYLHNILHAAMSAPSAGNERPWHFIVLKEKNNLDEISHCGPYSRMAKDANIAIVACGDINQQVHEGYWVQDLSAAVENMLIEIESLGLGAVWLGVYPIEERVKYIQNMFNLSKNIIPFAIIPIGYPASHPGSHDRYDKSRVHFEKW